MILLDNWVAVRIGEVRESDSVLSVSFPRDRKRRLRLSTAKVIGKVARRAEVYKVVTSMGDIKITPEHPILDYRRRWVAIEPDRAPVKSTRMREGMLIRFTVKPETFDEDENYIRGYLTGALRGDGSLTHYVHSRTGKPVPFFKFAVKDQDFLMTVKKYLEVFGISLPVKRVYCGLYRQVTRGLVSGRKDVFHRIEELMTTGSSLSWYRGFLAGLFDAEGGLSEAGCLRIKNTDKELLELACKGLERLGIPYVYESYGKVDAIRIGRIGHIAKFFMRTHPKIRRKTGRLIGRSLLTTTMIEEIEPIGEELVYNLETDKGVFICNGFITHNCQNWRLSKFPPDPSRANYVSPGDMVRLAVESACQGISVSFTEPTLLFEYSLDIFPLALERGLYTNYVSNGYMTVEALRMLREARLQALKVDVKGGKEAVRRYCQADVEVVWRNAEEAKRMGIHVEVVNLIIPGVNDDESSLREVVENHVKRLGPDTPIHFTAYFPAYRFDAPPTPVEKLEEAYELAKRYGVNYPYIGNVPGHRYENTYCPNCGALLIKRFGLSTVRIRLTDDGRCPRCGMEIPIRLWPRGRSTV